MGKTSLDALDLKHPLQAIDEVRFYVAGAQTAGMKKSAALVGFAGEIVGTDSTTTLPDVVSVAAGDRSARNVSVGPPPRTEE